LASVSKRVGIVAVVLASTLLIWVAEPAAGQFSDWSVAQSLGPVVNTSVTDGCPSVAKDDLTLFFASNRPGGFGNFDIYVTQRDSESDPWQTPVNAGPAVNGPGNELCPTIATNSHHLLFVSDRPGGCGGQDLYVSWRRDKRDDFGWRPPENLGCVVNSALNDFAPSIFENESTGEMVLYFSSNRAGGPGGTDIYSSTQEGVGVFGPATIVWELSTAFDDQRPYLRKDGLEVFFDSNRPGSLGSDMWTSIRYSTGDSWFSPANLGAAVNSAATEGRPALSFDGKTLYFMSSRGLDLYFATRTKQNDVEP
jgi:hypothetical protein